MQDFRGVQKATIGGLTPLTVLIGPNSSGKSTILDALLIGTSLAPGDAVGRVVKRRNSAPTAQWIFYDRGSAASVAVDFTEEQTGVRRVTKLSWKDREHTRQASSAGQEEALGAVEVIVQQPTRKLGDASAVFFAGNRYVAKEDFQEKTQLRRAAQEVRLVDFRHALQDPQDALTDAKEQGRAGAAVELLREVVPGLQNLEILKLGSEFGVWMVFEDQAIPLVMAGDGVRILARLCLDLASRPQGLVLLEEPEIHQHHRSLRMSAQAVVSAVRRGIQVVIATHSLDLIDELLGAAEREELLEKTSIQRLRLTGGILETTAFAGAEAKRIRSELEMDLR